MNIRHRRRRTDRRGNGRRHRRAGAFRAGQGLPPHRSACRAHHPRRSGPTPSVELAARSFPRSQTRARKTRRRSAAQRGGDSPQRRLCGSGRRTDRHAHGDLGGGHPGFARRRMDRREMRSRGPHSRQSRSVGAGASGGLRHRRHSRGVRRQGRTATRRGAGRQAAGRLCGRSHQTSRPRRRDRPNRSAIATTAISPPSAARRRSSISAGSICAGSSHGFSGASRMSIS